MVVGGVTWRFLTEKQEECQVILGRVPCTKAEEYYSFFFSAVIVRLTLSVANVQLLSFPPLPYSLSRVQEH